MFPLLNISYPFHIFNTAAISEAKAKRECSIFLPSVTSQNCFIAPLGKHFNKATHYT